MKICPITGSDGCLESDCLFYQNQYTKDYMCVFEAGLSHLNELCANLRILVDSNEQHRELHTQFVKSGLNKKPSPELLKLTGLKQVGND